MFKQKPITFSRRVWQWPAAHAAWYFVYVDGDLLVSVQKIIGNKKGLIPIEITVGTTTWRTSLLPYRKEHCYLIALKKKVRYAERIQEHDNVTISFWII